MAKKLTITWAAVSKGVSLDMGGAEYRVEKIKVKGKRATVTVSGANGSFTREVKAKDEVAIYRVDGERDKAKKPGKGPLREGGAQARWATEKEARASEPVVAPDPDGPRWGRAVGKAENRLTKILGAHLVGESVDGEKSWYVPPVDASTVAGHLLLFHDLEADELSPTALLELHEREHARALVAPFTNLHVDHWHTERRPS